MATGDELTRLLGAWRDGDRRALDAVVTELYAPLREIAARHLRCERGPQSMGPTDLLGEAYLRLVAAPAPHTHDRLHFFAIAARTMRQVLVDHARSRGAAKRGAGEPTVTLDEDLVGGERPDALLELGDALDTLAAMDPRKARIIDLTYFAGLTQHEIATVLEVHVNTVARERRVAEAWLHAQLAG